MNPDRNADLKADQLLEEGVSLLVFMHRGSVWEGGGEEGCLLSQLFRQVLTDFPPFLYRKPSRGGRMQHGFRAWFSSDNSATQQRHKD